MSRQKSAIRVRCFACTAICFALRRAEPALSIGTFELVQGSEHILAYRRHHGASRLQIMLNLSGTERRLPDGLEPGTLLLSTLGSQPPEGWLRPDEGVILRLAEA